MLFFLIACVLGASFVALMTDGLDMATSRRGMAEELDELLENLFIP